MSAFAFTRRRSPRHRSVGQVLRRSEPLCFEPRHCGGDGCLHNHAGGSRPLPGRMRDMPPVRQQAS